MTCSAYLEIGVFLVGIIFGMLIITFSAGWAQDLQRKHEMTEERKQKRRRPKKLASSWLEVWRTTWQTIVGCGTIYLVGAQAGWWG